MLTVENLAVSYGQSRILEGVSLEVPAGQISGLLGRNGVGKTTLLKTIMGVLKPSNGSIEFKGKAITAWPSYKRARAGLAYVPQGRGIFPYLTVKENMLLGLEVGRNLSENNLDEMYRLFPVLKQMEKRLAGTLSGGQQQQLALARALISQPEILLLDEPTEGIQPSIVLEIEEVLLSLKAKGEIAILLVEQFLDFALGVADFCYVMEKGNIVAQGPTADLTQAAVSEFLSV